MLEILGLAHQYGFVDLETAISDFLRQALSLTNVCAIFDAARLYQLHYLIRVCATFMDNQASQIITHESFSQLSPVGLRGFFSNFGTLENYEKIVELAFKIQRSY